jgi:hypothetical protein
VSAPVRPELPAMPSPIAALPRHRGYPVPAFVQWIDGVPDFRVVDARKIREAATRSSCWICGRPILGHRAYVVGPMCAVNRTSAEPPSHWGCARFAAEACPFLVRPHARRREVRGELGDAVQDAAGTMIRRNPGVTLLWGTVPPLKVQPVDGGLLFDLGTPRRVEWWAEGRRATPREILASIETGLPSLRAEAAAEGPDAVAELERMTVRALRLVPDR